MQKDRMAVWQHEHYVKLALGMGFGLPILLRYLWGGWESALGAFLIAGAAMALQIVALGNSPYVVGMPWHAVWGLLAYAGLTLVLWIATDGKRPWLEPGRTGTVLVRPAYRVAEMGEPWPNVHDYRIRTVGRFLRDLGVYS